MIGFVFADSKRYLAPLEAAAISKAVPGVAKVGVFVNAPPDDVVQIARACRLDYVQLHGDESPAYCRQLGLPVIKAFAVKDHCCYDEMALYPADFILLDTFSPHQTGGTGTVFDWQQAAAGCQRIVQPVLAAGGLTADNVARAIAVLQPAGVDVSGGVETNGSKDNAKIFQFVQAVRNAGKGEKLC